MAKKQFTLSKYDATILGNRILSQYRASSKSEIARDNLIYKELNPHISEVEKAEKDRQDKIISLSQKNECQIRGDLILYTGKNKDEAEKVTEKVKKELEAINKRYEDETGKKVNLSIEAEVFNYMKECFNQVVDNLCEADKKADEHNLKIEDSSKEKTIQLNKNMKEVIGRIDDALEDAKKIN